jgi:ppGpp synthetase/RelA/SpoT-type nucleotidyltranferase
MLLDEKLEQELLDYYENRLQPELATFARNVANILRNDSTVAREVKPLIVWRMKSRDSLQRKLRDEFGEDSEHDTPLTPETLIENIQDLAGVRVIVHDRTNIDKMLDVLGEQVRQGRWRPFKMKVIDWDKDVRDQREYPLDSWAEREWVKRGTYRSRHIIIGDSQFGSIRCEVQFRSVIEEAMFEAHHRLIYRVTQLGGDPAPKVEEMLGPMTEMFSSLDDIVSDCYRWDRERTSEDGT